MADKPTVGRIVHYVLPADSKYPLAHRAALVTGEFGGTAANLSVYLDQKGDIPHFGDSFVAQHRVTSATYDETGKIAGTWHWPERVLPPTESSGKPQSVAYDPTAKVESPPVMNATPPVEQAVEVAPVMIASPPVEQAPSEEPVVADPPAVAKPVEDATSTK